MNCPPPREKVTMIGPPALEAASMQALMELVGADDVHAREGKLVLLCHAGRHGLRLINGLAVRGALDLLAHELTHLKAAAGAGRRSPEGSLPVTAVLARRQRVMGTGHLWLPVRGRELLGLGLDLRLAGSDLLLLGGLEVFVGLLVRHPEEQDLDWASTI